MEEKAFNGENTENFSGGDTVADGVEEALGKAYANESGNDRSRELEAENMRLRGELACAKVGVPGEIAGDIISIAVNMKNAGGVTADEGFVLEEAVREVYGRICSAVYGVNDHGGKNSGKTDYRMNGAFGKGSSGVTTGVRSERGFDDTDAALRRACGLKG